MKRFKQIGLTVLLFIIVLFSILTVNQASKYRELELELASIQNERSQLEQELRLLAVEKARLEQGIQLQEYIENSELRTITGKDLTNVDFPSNSDQKGVPNVDQQ